MTEIEKQIKIKNMLRGFMVSNGYTLERLAKELTKHTGVNHTTQSISNKLSRGSIRFLDVLEICEVMGYSVEFKKIEK